MGERDDYMDENTELLLFIYQNAKMGVNSCTELIRILNGKDNKIKKDVEGELKGYESFVKKSEKLMRDHNITPKDKGVMVNIMSKMGMNMEMMKDNSDARIADMLTKGFTMGNVDISKKIDRYEGDCEKDIFNMARRLVEFGEVNIVFFKIYL